ncbi:tRNA lysidine(34) synthetase TilS [Clostridium carnis]
MIDKVKSFIKENKLLEKGDKVLVALSGGPDSICLLHLLNSLKEEYKLSVAAAHVNHMLRGDEAVEDEDYVKKFCDDLNIPCYIERIDIDKISKKKGISHEMAGREERYALFERIRINEGYNKIAIAHNANDQAETVLMRMMRGTGIEGLCGIKAKRSGGIIRPILCLGREEIEKYCYINNLDARIDKTNLEKKYNRNKIRLDILPYMKNNFNNDIIETINRMALLIQKDNEFIEKKSIEEFEKHCERNKDFFKIKKSLFSLEEAMVTRVIKISLIEYSKKYNNFEMKHIFEIINLAKNETSKKVDITNNIVAENIYGDIILKRRKNNKALSKKENKVEINKKNLKGQCIEFEEYIVNIDIMEMKNNIEFSNNDLIKFFDYDNIKEGLCIRTRRDGDKIKPLGMKGQKKIKDIFIDMKVPKEYRDKIPIVSFDGNIGWIVGYKVSEDYKIKKETKNIIKIIFTRKE